MKTFPNVKPLASGQWKSMSKSLWIILNAQWNWFCELSSSLGEEPRVPKVAKPISKTQLKKLRNIAGGELPQEFEKLITEYSRHVTFWSGVPEDEFDLPEELESFGFGGDDLWNNKHFADYCKEMVESESSEWLSFRTGLKDRLPFYPVGNGDYLAMCMRNGIKNCPVVYLSHDNDARVHERRIAPNVIDFIVNWSSLGCCNVELLETFINKKEKRLNGYGRAGNKFRKQLQALVGQTAEPKSSTGQPTGDRFTNEWFYQQWRRLSHDKCPKLAESDVNGLMMRTDINITDEFVPDDWGTEGQMLQFFYSAKKGTYWSHRWDSRNQNGERQILGPLKIPD